MKPKLIFLVGPPACGKTTYANRKFRDGKTVILSSDEIRKELFGDETIQTKNAVVFETLYQRMRTALSSGKDVVIDATNINKQTRKLVFDALGNIPAKKIAIVIKTPKAICHNLNNGRTRIVPDPVIDEYFNMFEQPTKEEGFDKIKNKTVEIIF